MNQIHFHNENFHSDLQTVIKITALSEEISVTSLIYTFGGQRSNQEWYKKITKYMKLTKLKK